MEKLRAALELLDEALDGLEEAATRTRAEPAMPTLPRDEMARRLDAVIVDMQDMLGRAA